MRRKNNRIAYCLAGLQFFECGKIIKVEEQSDVIYDVVSKDICMLNEWIGGFFSIKNK